MNFVFINLFKIILIILILFLCVAYLTFWERKLLAWIQLRLGPNRLGIFGLLQPISDIIKLLFKEIIIPNKSNKSYFFIAPILIIIPSLIIWAVIPFNKFILANINSSLLFIIAITSIEIYGIIIAGWSSNSKYAFLGATRAAAQMISYEISMSFCIIIITLISNSSNLSEIVLNQNKGFFFNIGLNFLSWNWLLIFPIFIIYFISCIAEINRHPFDVVECESEIIAGHMIEYSGISFALFFLAEYINMIFISILITLIFFGGWLPILNILSFIPYWIWFILKFFFIISFIIWIRTSIPRYKYDQIMRLGWKFFIPITLLILIIISSFIQFFLK